MHICCLNCQNRKMEYVLQSMKKPCESTQENCPYDIYYPDWNYDDENYQNPKNDRHFQDQEMESCFQMPRGLREADIVVSEEAESQSRISDSSAGSRLTIGMEIPEKEIGVSYMTGKDLDELESISEKYYELVMVVKEKCPGESRHQTALRLLKEAQADSVKAEDSARRLPGIHFFLS